MKYKLAWKPDIPDFRDYRFKITKNQVKTLPKSVDLSARAPSVRDQKSGGACTGFATRGIFAYVSMKELQKFDPSPLFIYYNARKLGGNVQLDEGAYLRDSVKSVVKFGVCGEVYWPYRVGKITVSPTQTSYKEALGHQALKYQRLDNRDINQLKVSISLGIPFVCGISCYSNMFTAEVERTGVVPSPSGSLEGGHAIWFLGYNDRTKLFKFQNSWSAGWGDRGYGYLPYSYLTDPDLADDFWNISDVE